MRTHPSKQSKDHPGIYRNKNWIDNEDKMFYELTAKCPEYFKDCKTTFEHLVMMQHYGYPTRLLDITLNPLVALYFACGGLNGSNSEDGQLISYHIKKNDIRNYDSDRVNLLSNLSLASNSLNCEIFLVNFVQKRIQNFLALGIKDIYNFDENDGPEMISLLKKIFTCIKADRKEFAEEYNYEFYFDAQLKEKSNQKNVLLEYKKLCEAFDQIGISSDLLFQSVDEYIDFCKKKLLEINNIKICIVRLLWSLDEYNQPHNFIKYNYKIRGEKLAFDSSAIIPSDMRTIQCVLPKQNNPRLIAQQGAFLLFGFKDAVSDKTATPVVDPKMYGELCNKDNKGKILKDQNSGQKAEIIIKGSAKQDILDELKILGISNSTMFPEIDNIANELKSQYAKS